MAGTRAPPSRLDPSFTDTKRLTDIMAQRCQPQIGVFDARTRVKIYGGLPAHTGLHKGVEF